MKMRADNGATEQGLTSPGPRSKAEIERDLDAAHDWLINYVSACEISATGHYFHMCEGQHKTCGCRWEGNDDPR